MKLGPSLSSQFSPIEVSLESYKDWCLLKGRSCSALTATSAGDQKCVPVSRVFVHFTACISSHGCLSTAASHFAHHSTFLYSDFCYHCPVSALHLFVMFWKCLVIRCLQNSSLNSNLNTKEFHHHNIFSAKRLTVYREAMPLKASVLYGHVLTFFFLDS